MPAFVATANPGFAPLAMEELRRRFPGLAVSGLAPGETFLLETPDLPADELVRSLRRDEPIFLRHLFPVQEEAPLAAGGPDVGEAMAGFVRSQADRLAGRKAAVQVRKAPDSPFPYSSAEGRDAVIPALREMGAEPVVRDADWIISFYAAKRTLYMGASAPKDNLSDWPGGAMRFRREEGLISRAAFKLLEAERTFGLQLDRVRHALDLGAAPGGWTHVLLQRGAKVTAVDPAELHPALEGHPTLRHLRRNAAGLSFPPGTFDLMVCDMSWDPHRTSRLVREQATALSAGASALVTLKLMYRKPLQTIAELSDAYADDFEIRRIKQLFHNREEVTIWLKRRP